MASFSDIGTAAAINILSAIAFLIAFAILRLQPFNDRVYFPKWYLKGIRGTPTHSGAFVNKFVNLDCRTYLRFLNWMPAALRMPEPELIDHAGLDSAVRKCLAIILRTEDNASSKLPVRFEACSDVDLVFRKVDQKCHLLKLFVPVALLAFAVLVPVNWTGDSLEHTRNLTFSNIDKFSISNVPSGSQRFWAHIVMAYIFTFWAFFVLYKEYKRLTNLRLHFLASENRRPDQFTVLVRNIPPDPDESVSEHVEHFFCVNHPDHYLTHQVVRNANALATLVEKKKGLKNRLNYYQNKYDRNPNKKPTTKKGFLGLWGETVDAIDYYTLEIEILSKEEATERERVLNDPNAIVPAAFVSFKSRWAAAVCAQTQQSSNPTTWLTEWAPEPRDSIANIEGIEKVFPFLKVLVENKVTKSVVQGFLPGIALKIFLILLPTILMTMSKIEGYTSLSSLERRSAGKYHLFIIVNVFLGSVVTGTAFEQLKKFIHQSATDIPKTIGVSIPMKATFFITYIMVDGWAGIAGEILRLIPLIIFHLKNAFLVKTEKDREQAMDPGHLDFASSEPRIQLYFLLGLVYSVVTPILLPFIIVFFGFAYLVFRHQIINVYDQKYESAAAFWPDVHRRLIIGMIISQLLLIGLMSTTGLKLSTPFLLVLPILTITFHRFCKGRFEAAFVKFPLQEAMVRDTLERATDPNFNLKSYLQDAFIHPVFNGGEIDKPLAFDEEENNPLVLTKRNSRRNTPNQSKHGSEIGSEAGPQ
ncbi:hypothetical protein Sjap_007762 [Stephania japonica]|uniref:CSC1-like protein At4g02900 n=1 Tax=Stephania japonica TaxID=461633 RepID=A0AAP0PA85_9MAGN